MLIVMLSHWYCSDMDLLSAWAAWKSDAPPFLLEEDRDFITRLSTEKRLVHGWRDGIAGPDFGNPDDRRFHFGLLPMPFVGNLRRASVYILLLNPGQGPHDYFGEYEVPDYRDALIANLRQERDSFLFLDPQFSWHGGFDYWHRKLAGLITELAKQTSYASARSRLAHELACIELIPYHSPSFHDPGNWRRQLPSALLARRFVHEHVVPKARSGEAVVVVARQAQVWDLPEHDRIVRYRGAESRAAHLTPNSRGGRAILKHLTPRSYASTR